MGPEIDIQVDPQTGIWTSDGLPMIYAPRHWFVGMHTRIEARMGRDAYADLLYGAGYDAAKIWCQSQADHFGLRGLDVLTLYLEKTSARGLAQFSLLHADIDAGRIEIGLRNCCYVLHNRHVTCGADSLDTLCYAFVGSFTGAADWVAADMGLDRFFNGRERECSGQHGVDMCVIEVTAPVAR